MERLNGKPKPFVKDNPDVSRVKLGARYRGGGKLFEVTTVIPQLGIVEVKEIPKPKECV